jgi:hypothetical protein
VDLNTLEKLITLCKKHGVTRCKTEEFEFELPGKPAPGPVGKDMESLAQALADGTSTPEEVLFLSAPQFQSQEQVIEMLKKMRGGG